MDEYVAKLFITPAGGIGGEFPAPILFDLRYYGVEQVRGYAHACERLGQKVRVVMPARQGGAAAASADTVDRVMTCGLIDAIEDMTAQLVGLPADHRFEAARLIRLRDLRSYAGALVETIGTILERNGG
jgi:hypothetical protein